MRVFHGVSLSLVAHRAEGVTRSRVLRTARLYRCNNNNNSSYKVIVTIKPSAHDDTCLKYNSFHVLRVKSHSHLLSHFVFVLVDSHTKIKKKKWSHSLSLSRDFIQTSSQSSTERARDERHTRKEKHAFFFPLSLSRLKRLDSNSSSTTQTRTTT